VRPRRSLTLLVPALLVLATPPASAQELELQPLFLILAEAEAATDVDASSLQVYRMPVSFTLRSFEQHRWGLKLRLPLSVGAHDLRASTDVGDFAERVETVSVAPGLELLLRTSDRWVVKPFAEVSLTDASSSTSTGTLYSLGLRARGQYTLDRHVVTAGVAARYSSNRSSRVRIEDYTTVEAGADIQWPLRRHFGGHRVRVGGYAILRYFPDLDLPSSLDQGAREVFELGVSFSTVPRVALWKLELPWIGIGYRHGGPFRGIRFNLSFPF
jgi:hypothetical protein